MPAYRNRGKITVHIVLVRAIAVVAVIAWTVSAIDVSPWLFDLAADLRLFVVAVGCVSSYALISRAHTWPATEVYLAGRESGRREVLAEMRPDRRLRAVD